MSVRFAILLLLSSVCLTPVFGADPPPGVHCDGIYCRESEDRDWHVRIAGEVISPAGVYFVVSGVESNVIVRGRIPKGRYLPESPFTVKVPRDGVAGDYLLTLFGTQVDYGSIQTPYTDLPFEVYGKEVEGRTFLHVIAQGAASTRPLADRVPGGLFFQVPTGAEDLTISQAIPWTLHALDGSVVFDVSQQGKREGRDWVGTFKGSPGTTYILGHGLYWFYASPRLYVAVSPDRWFVPDPRLQLDPAWWRQRK